MRFLFSFAVIICLAVVASLGYFYSQVSVDLSSIVDYRPKLSTQIYDRNGELVANVFDEENRQYVKYEDIPPRIVEALVAIEDTGFFEHTGINYEAIFRAAIKDVKAMTLKEGASTLTQQLIKNMVLTREKKFTRKLKEVVLAFEIETKLSKEEIIERYLNQVYFGHGYYGIKTAAAGYFKKDLKDLNLKEIGILVGLPKAPSSYDPTKHADLSLSRANSVIERMYALGWVNSEQYKSALSESPIIFDETLTQNRAPYLVDEAIKTTSKLYPDIKTGGYKIYLTADLKIQDMARNALKFGYGEILKRDKNASIDVLNGAMVVTNPLNGDILAMIGGVDYAKSSFNRATQSLRQPGSSFKPFIYQIALDLGYSPASEVEDLPRVFEGADANKKDWRPKNYGNDYLGFIPMRTALKKSRNLATINLLNMIGLDIAKEELEKFGFIGVPPNLSIALGSFGVSPYEFAERYSMFPGMGSYSKNRLVTSVLTPNGTTQNFSSEKIDVEEPAQAYLMIDMLKSVVNSGTGTRANVAGIEIAGKTGTTNDNIDAWFCGFTPEVQAVIWFGNDDNTPMRKIEGGGRTAAPVFHEFMTSYLQTFPETKRSFDKPKGVMHASFKGEDELYTAVSPLPSEQKNNSVQTQESEGLLF